MQLREWLGDDDVPQPGAQVVHEQRYCVAQRRGNVLGGMADLQAGIVSKVRREGRDIHISVATLCRCHVFGGMAHVQAGIFPFMGQGGMRIFIVGAREQEYSHPWGKEAGVRPHTWQRSEGCGLHQQCFRAVLMQGGSKGLMDRQSHIT